MSKKDSGWGSFFLGVAALGYLAHKDSQENKRRLLEEERIRKEREDFYKNNSEPTRKESGEEKTEPNKSIYTKEEIHKLYRKLSKKYHPDFAQSEQDKEFRSKLFIKIKNAYDLGEMETLKLYDL